MTFADTLRSARDTAQITRVQMCAHLWAMPLRTYEDIESGRRTPPEWVQSAVLERVEKKLKIPVVKPTQCVA